MLVSNAKAIASGPPARHASNRHRKRGKGLMKTSDRSKIEETPLESADEQ